jgi:hypothetical protein
MTSEERKGVGLDATKFKIGRTSRTGCKAREMLKNHVGTTRRAWAHRINDISRDAACYGLAVCPVEKNTTTFDRGELADVFFDGGMQRYLSTRLAESGGTCTVLVFSAGCN